MFLMIDDSVVILKVGQVINMEFNGCVDVLIPQLDTKPMVNIAFLLMTGMIAILQEIGLIIVYRIVLFRLF